MKYPSSSLANDETIVFDVHHHPFTLSKPALPFLVFLVVWLVLLTEVGFFREGWALIAGLAVLAALAIYFAWRIAVWSHVNFVLTDRRLVYQSGVVTKHSREIPLSRVNDVTGYQMVLGRMVGMGDIVIEVSEKGKAAFFDLPDPGKLKLAILEAVHAARADTPRESARSLAREVAREVKREQPTSELAPLPPERPPLYSEIVDQIERLDSMRERGVITEEEFEEAKRSLLDKLKKEPEL
jgi:uncharacterized membrane protein YdbT with pleckstrin-like domain